MDTPTYKFALREDLKDDVRFLPSRAEPHATGWDVRCAEPNGVIIRPGEYTKIRLGFRGFCPSGWWYELKPRSSTFAKKHLHALYGTVDSTFENELVFASQFQPDWVFKDDEPVNVPNLVIGFGEAIGQIIPIKLQEMVVAQVTNEEYDRLCKDRNGIRRDGGFGSTG